MKHGKLSFITMALVMSLMCMPGVHAKYVQVSAPMVFGLETKTSVPVYFHCSELGTVLPRDSGKDAWEYDGGTKRLAKSRIILGDQMYGTEKYGEQWNAIPEPVRSDAIFMGWQSSENPEFTFTRDADVMFTGDYTVFVPIFEKIKLNMTDENGCIPEAAGGELWTGSGSSASAVFYSNYTVDTSRLPNLVDPSGKLEFVGWFYVNGQGEEVQIVLDETILEKHSYDVYAKWNDKPASQSLNISNSVY